MTKIGSLKMMVLMFGVSGFGLAFAGINSYTAWDNWRLKNKYDEISSYMLNYSFYSLTCISFLGCCDDISISSDNLQNSSVPGSYTRHSSLMVNRHRTYTSNAGKNTIAFDHAWKVRNYFFCLTIFW